MPTILHSTFIRTHAEAEHCLKAWALIDSGRKRSESLEELKSAARQKRFDSFFEGFLSGPWPNNRRFWNRTLNQIVLTAAGERRKAGKELPENGGVNAMR